MPKPVDVLPVGSPPMPSLPTSNAHLAPVPPAAVSEGVATTLPASPTGVAVIPSAYVPYVILGSMVAMGLGEELSNPAPLTVARVGGILLKLGAVGLAAASQGQRKAPAQ